MSGVIPMWVWDLGLKTLCKLPITKSVTVCFSPLSFFPLIPNFSLALTLYPLYSFLFIDLLQINVTPNCKTCLSIARILDECMLPGKSKVHVTSSVPSSPPLSCSCAGHCTDNFLGVSSFCFYILKHIYIDVFD